MLHRRGFCLAGFAVLAPVAGRTQTPLERLAEGGTVALMRHASAPGTGDPPEFRLGDCTTQRNLSEVGRLQAAGIGRRLREAGVLVTQVRSSRWCRALDTARFAFPDVPVTPDATLDSFFADSRTAERQTEDARALVARWIRRQGTLVLVTHQVNITALSGIYPAEGDVVVLVPQEGAQYLVAGTAKL